MSDTDEFRNWIIQLCATDPGPIEADGKWHRFRIADTRHKASKPGRYLMHADGKANGIFMDWREQGRRHKWFSGNEAESIDRAEINRKRAERLREREIGFAKAAEAAIDFWKRCEQPDGLHPYLVRKGLTMAHGTRVGSGKVFGLGDVPCVIVPLSDARDRPMSLQAIREDGERRFWPGSTTEGSHYLLGSVRDESSIIFCEGMATAGTLREATGGPVVMCVMGSNMAKVAAWAPEKWPNAKIVAGDDDTHLVERGKANEGALAAQGMAREMRASLIMPQLHGADGSDFNDQAAHYGLDDVRAMFVAPPAPEIDKLVRATSFAWRPSDQIPKRQWLYGKHLLRKFVSLDVAAGGVGKSSLKVGEAIAMASGRDIYGKVLHEGALRVWLWNLEDPHEEIERRIHATCQHFKIEPSEMADRLFVDSGRDQPLVIATEGNDGVTILRPIVDALVEELIAMRIDVLSVDPFISSHAVSENDNGAIDAVAREWNQVAERANCAIDLVHHVRKQNGAEATADSARGASALIGKARSVLVYNRMSSDEAASLGVNEDERRFFFRVDNDKANLAPPDATDWYRMNNVDLANGDSVGVACPWAPDDVFQGVTIHHLRQVQNAIGQGKWRESKQAKAWAGYAVGTVLDLDMSDQMNRRRVEKLLRRWLAEGVLEIVKDKDEKSMERDFVVVARWVSD